ncbi:isochorismatase hydrolase [Chrysochromulina tobinii]|uniref:Isochorismatase hydrolase n=1 Tax=Chrysochromulina tobinii TaxID=1460289 RepID=A0A0M0K4U1_9EUKA|nr:isochorismatase hydrolase [Chrysochromulina tobinii]|eukprot:KOO33393.1 isochorismatase hydrolase [Chrysochromulina sp. CCMP291]
MRRQIISPATTALVVIDMQGDFCVKNEDTYLGRIGLSVANTREPIRPLQVVLSELRRRNFAIIHTREGHRPSLSDCPELKLWRSKMQGCELGTVGASATCCSRALVRGQPSWDIIAELKPAEGEDVVDGCGKGKFLATDLDLLLRQKGVTTLIFGGVTTSCCVATTMREATDLGYECFVLSDGTGDLGVYDYLDTIRMVGEEHVLSSEAFLVHAVASGPGTKQVAVAGDVQSTISLEVGPTPSAGDIPSTGGIPSTASLEAVSACPLCGSPLYLDAAAHALRCPACECASAVPGILGTNALGNDCFVDHYSGAIDYAVLVLEHPQWFLEALARARMSDSLATIDSHIDLALAAAAVFSELNDEIDWARHHDMLADGRMVSQPRSIAYQADDASLVYVYEGLAAPLVPTPFTPFVRSLKVQVEKLCGGVAFNSAHLNLYKDGTEHVSWHTDQDVTLYGDSPTIASVSFGAEREFVLRRMMRLFEFHTYLAGGDLLTGFDRHYDGGSLLTMVVMLSDPARDFEGGRLVVSCPDEWESTERFVEVDLRQPGDCVVFPSHKYHNVTEVTRGKRHVAVVELWNEHEGFEDARPGSQVVITLGQAGGDLSSEEEY